ncbi:hypothetical protein ACHAQE_010980 [Botrytis cinerea]
MARGSGENSTISTSTSLTKKKAQLISTLYTPNMEPHRSETSYHRPEEQLWEFEQNLSLTQQQQHSSAQTGNDEKYDIIFQLETRPISQEQLVAEVKGIYAGLVMVEAKCIEVDNKQATLVHGDPPTQSRLNNEQWQALIALHRTLLHEHHDFFLASQHPSASPALRRLASRYAMPARMWRHGIHSFLELLRHRLPGSLDHMLAFIYLAYSMMALLYETVPAFERTWIECLGDLGRYRMAIEDDDIRDREVWTGVARHWYSKASNKAPTTGRLYHHLAILGRPNALQQLYYYAKSLCVMIPFDSGRESILTFFDSFSHNKCHLSPLNAAFIQAHGYLFAYKTMERFEPTVKLLLGLLDSHIGQVTRKFMEQGYHIAISNITAIFGFGSEENPVKKSMTLSSLIDTADISRGRPQDNIPQSTMSFRYAEYLNNSVLEIVLKRIDDPNVLPFIHVTLVYLHRMSQSSATIALLAPNFPWQLLAIMLNALLRSQITLGRIGNNEFPLLEEKNGVDDVRPFPEDFAVRGLLWAETLYPEKYFLDDHTDEENKFQELSSMLHQRQERILWLACRVAARVSPWLVFDSSKPGFTTEARSADLQSQRECSMLSASTVKYGTIFRTGSYSSIETCPDIQEDISSDTVKAANAPSDD